MTAALTLDDPSPYFARLDEFEDRHWWPKTLRRVAFGALKSALGRRTGLTALDVGCGTGRNLKALEALGSIETVLGIEPEGQALRRADRPNLIRGSALNLPIATGLIDVLLCCDVLQHLPPGGDSLALAEFARVLRPNGVLLVRANAGGETGYRLSHLVEIVRSAGFRVEWASHVNVLPALAQEMRGRLAKGLRLSQSIAASHPSGGGLPAASRSGWGSRLMGCVAALEAEAMVRLRLTSPFGHSTLIVARRTHSP